MQNQNNNNTMISRQSGSRSGTPNSMVVLEQGRDSPPRPPSGRRSVNRRSPLKRGGSSLEILPAEEDDSSRTPSRLSNTGANTDSPRQTLSAGSVSRLSFTEVELGNGDGKGGGVGLKRSSSIDGRAEMITPDSPRKQVYLTTVKRNFEQHGMPKNEELAKAVQNLPSLQNGEISNSPSSTHKTHDSSHRKQHGERSDRLETDAENNDLKQPGDRLTLGEAGGQGSHDKGPDDEMNNTDSYYISHGSTSNSSKASASVSSSAENDSYYLTHDRASSSATSETAQTATDKTEEPTTQTDQVPGGTVTSDAKEEADDENESDDDDDDDDEDEDNEEDEEGKAPFQLLGEFLEAVMEEDYENAEKLCKMVLLYEPENAEAKQFQPLIEEMLKREREAQLWGSESEDEDDDADDDDDDSDDSDDDDDSDEDSDKDEDEEESSSEEEEDEANEDKSDTHVEK